MMRIRNYLPVAGVPEPRCAGCGWPPVLLGPSVPLIDFDSVLSRGKLTRKDMFPVETINDVVMCGECVTRAAFLFDPEPVKMYHERVEALKAAAGDELVTLTREIAGLQQDLKRKGRQVAKLTAARDERVKLEGVVDEWLVGFGPAVEAVQAATFKVWAFERAAGDDEWTRAELEGERKRLADATRKLRALEKAGEALRVQCETHGLDSRAAQIRERLLQLMIGKAGE